MGDVCENEPQVEKATRESTDVKETCYNIFEKFYVPRDRLSQLALLSIKSNRAESLDLERFVDDFYSRHDNRRIKLHCTDLKRITKTN